MGKVELLLVEMCSSYSKSLHFIHTYMNNADGDASGTVPALFSSLHVTLYFILHIEFCTSNSLKGFFALVYPVNMRFWRQEKSLATGRNVTLDHPARGLVIIPTTVLQPLAIILTDTVMYVL
jgi:hypothetical protein